MEPILLDACTYLSGLLELRELQPDFRTWDETQLASNPPRLVRLQCLQALGLALGIGADPARVLRGNWIEERPLGDYEWLGPPSPWEESRVSALEATWRDGLRLLGLGRSIARFGRELVPVVRDNVVGQQQALAGPQGELQRTLARFLVPTERSFPRAQLQADFGYPETDLGELDVCWW